jgi:hypothetical protein
MSQIAALAALFKDVLSFVEEHLDKKELKELDSLIEQHLGDTLSTSNGSSSSSTSSSSSSKKSDTKPAPAKHNGICIRTKSNGVKCQSPIFSHNYCRGCLRTKAVWERVLKLSECPIPAGGTRGKSAPKSAPKGKAGTFEHLDSDSSDDDEPVFSKLNGGDGYFFEIPDFSNALVWAPNADPDEMLFYFGSRKTQKDKKSGKTFNYVVPITDKSLIAKLNKERINALPSEKRGEVLKKFKEMVKFKDAPLAENFDLKKNDPNSESDSDSDSDYDSAPKRPPARGTASKKDSINSDSDSDSFDSEPDSPPPKAAPKAAAPKATPKATPKTAQQKKPSPTLDSDSDSFDSEPDSPPPKAAPKAAAPKATPKATPKTTTSKVSPKPAAPKAAPKTTQQKKPEDSFSPPKTTSKTEEVPESPKKAPESDSTEKIDSDVVKEPATNGIDKTKEPDATTTNKTPVSDQSDNDDSEDDLDSNREDESVNITTPPKKVRPGMTTRSMAAAAAK